MRNTEGFPEAKSRCNRCKMRSADIILDVTYVRLINITVNLIKSLRTAGFYFICFRCSWRYEIIHTFIPATGQSRLSTQHQSAHPHSHSRTERHTSTCLPITITKSIKDPRSGQIAREPPLFSAARSHPLSVPNFPGLLLSLHHGALLFITIFSLSLFDDRAFLRSLGSTYI